MMRKTMAAMLALALLLGCLPGALATSYMVFPTGPLEIAPTPAPTAKPYIYVEFKGDSTIYRKAGSNPTDIKILAGSVAPAVKLSKDKRWVQIIYGSTKKLTGWVRYSRLRKSSLQFPMINYASRSQGSARVDLKTEAKNLAGQAFRVRVSTKVYKSGRSNSKVLGKLKKGLSVVATGKLSVDPTGVFLVQVAYRGKLGWVPETSLRGASAAINKKVLK